MKKMLLIIFLTTVSCSNNIDNNLKDFALDLIENNYKIKDLKAFYPILYNDTIIYFEMKDSVYLAKLINFIRDDFCPIKSGYDIFEVGTDRGYLRIFENYGSQKGYNYILNSDSINNFFICRKNKCLDFMFYKKNDLYYIFYIGENVKHVDL